MNSKTVPYRLEGKRVAVVGDRGMVGSALVRRLASENCEILGINRSNVDLRRQQDVDQFFADLRPDLVLVAAAKVGGIHANRSLSADFIYDNLMIAANVINASKIAAAEKLVFLGSSCIYPKEAPQPIPEEALLTGPLEPTNEWYAVAKIAGIKMCQAYRRQHGCDFISVQPTNLYGPGDNYDLSTSHVVPALIRKAHEAKESKSPVMSVWGSGRPFREFLHVDDLADAVVHIAKWYSNELPLNVGTGAEVTIAELANEIAAVVGFRGRIEFDHSYPDGTYRKLVDSRRVRELGWEPKIGFREGLRTAYGAFLSSNNEPEASR